MPKIFLSGTIFIKNEITQNPKEEKMKKYSVGIFIFLCMIINVAFGYTLTVNNFVMEVDAGRKVNLTAPEKSGKSFLKWQVISGDLTLNNPTSK